MTTLQLDTSGYIMLPSGEAYSWDGSVVGTKIVPNFAQGYIEAALLSALFYNPSTGKHEPQPFHKLAPETVQRIIEDCARCVWKATVDLTSDSGGQFYRRRQAGRFEDFPPLTVTLCDDGKVRFGDSAGKVVS